MRCLYSYQTTSALQLSPSNSRPLKLTAWLTSTLRMIPSKRTLSHSDVALPCALATSSIWSKEVRGREPEWNIFMLLRATPAALDVAAEPLEGKGLVPRSSSTVRCAEPQPVRSRRYLNWPTAAGRQVQMRAMPASALL